MSDDNLFSRMGIKNKTLGLDTYFDSTVPKFLGLPKELILEERRVYTNSLECPLSIFKTEFWKLKQS